MFVVTDRRRGAVSPNSRFVTYISLSGEILSQVVVEIKDDDDLIDFEYGHHYALWRTKAEMIECVMAVSRSMLSSLRMAVEKVDELKQMIEKHGEKMAWDSLAYDFVLNAVPNQASPKDFSEFQNIPW